jgi:Flp pilus assembly protein TadB
VAKGLFEIDLFQDAVVVKGRQAIGILGMVFAVAGGIAWYFRQTFIAVMLWGVAGLILLKLNKRRKNS